MKINKDQKMILTIAGVILAIFLIGNFTGMFSLLTDKGCPEFQTNVDDFGGDYTQEGVWIALDPREEGEYRVYGSIGGSKGTTTSWPSSADPSGVTSDGLDWFETSGNIRIKVDDDEDTAWEYHYTTFYKVDEITGEGPFGVEVDPNSIILTCEAPCDPELICGDWGLCTENEQIRKCESACGAINYETQNCAIDCDPENNVYGESTECIDGLQFVQYVNEECNSAGAEEQVCVCQEDWSCGEWSDCANSYQTRSCIDLNDCGTEDNKLDESQSCVMACVPSTEVCNDRDDDCDGVIDEGVMNTCKRPGGICEVYETCLDCPILVEICDGLDNDCDGATDEGCNCPYGSTKQCGTTSVGLCVYGTQTCVSGEWAECEGNIEPILEICDSHDNDCDGLTDEEVKTTCRDYNDGCSSYLKCGDCPDAPAEICDGEDNDCDGATDEGVTEACMNYDTCIEEEQCGACTTTPPIEVCDGIDNDCDGTTDENCACINTYTKACGTSTAGLCEMGTQTCVNGQWNDCVGEVLSVEEICEDGFDNDCDGETDENCPILCDQVSDCDDNDDDTLDSCESGECKFTHTEDPEDKNWIQDNIEVIVAVFAVFLLLLFFKGGK